ncbi:MAG: hypothetical protein GY859_31395 [Desulfobacterales bacterium]|nr:hypothetical protein [Desulfobacterales bacterium]
MFAACAALAMFFLAATPAHAYLDPGTGSMLVQALLATVAAVSVSLGLFWRRIRLFFDRLFGGRDNEGNNTDGS